MSPPPNTYWANTSGAMLAPHDATVNLNGPERRRRIIAITLPGVALCDSAPNTSSNHHINASADHTDPHEAVARRRALLVSADIESNVATTTGAPIALCVMNAIKKWVDDMKLP